MYSSLEEVLLAHHQLQEMIDISIEEQQSSIPLASIVDSNNSLMLFLSIIYLCHFQNCLIFGFAGLSTLKHWFSQRSHLYPNVASVLQSYFIEGHIYQQFVKPLMNKDVFKKSISTDTASTTTYSFFKRRYSTRITSFVTRHQCISHDARVVFYGQGWSILFATKIQL